MKKIVSMICAVSLSAALLVGCGSSASSKSAVSSESEVASSKEAVESTPVSAEATSETATTNPVNVNVTAMKGPTAMGIILALILFSSHNLSVLISFLMVLPIIYASVLEGIRAADHQLLEMAKLFRVPPVRCIRYVYLPQVMPYFHSACGSALGLCWKAGIAAEVIGMPRGSIGECLQQAKVYLDTPDLFAWTLVIVVISLAFEKVFIAFMNACAVWLERI